MLAYHMAKKETSLQIFHQGKYIIVKHEEMWTIHLYSVLLEKIFNLKVAETCSWDLENMGEDIWLRK